MHSFHMLFISKESKTPGSGSQALLYMFVFVVPLLKSTAPLLKSTAPFLNLKGQGGGA